jgi:hypothetical protein
MFLTHDRQKFPLSPAGTETLSIKLLQKTSSAQGAMFSLEILKLS